MPGDINNILYVKAEKCFESLSAAVRIFEGLLGGGVSSLAEYYRARNFLREGEAAYENTSKEAHRLLGPLPVYAAGDFDKWREEFLAKNRILAECRDFSCLQDELRRDELLARWLTPEEIDILINKNFEAQQKGKRQLSHIKVRIIMDKLKTLLDKARELNGKAKAGFQGLQA